MLRNFQISNGSPAPASLRRSPCGRSAARAYVERISGGKLGYVHIADMGDASLEQLYIDLDAENQGRQGVVIDLRNNNGGYVNGHALDVFTRRNYLMMTAAARPGWRPRCTAPRRGCAP